MLSKKWPTPKLIQKVCIFGNWIFFGQNLTIFGSPTAQRTHFPQLFTQSRVPLFSDFWQNFWHITRLKKKFFRAFVRAQVFGRKITPSTAIWGFEKKVEKLGFLDTSSRGPQIDPWGTFGIQNRSKMSKIAKKGSKVDPVFAKMSKNVQKCAKLCTFGNFVFLRWITYKKGVKNGHFWGQKVHFFKIRKISNKIRKKSRVKNGVSRDFLDTDFW